MVYSVGPDEKSKRHRLGPFSLFKWFFKTQGDTLINKCIVLPAAPVRQPPEYAWDVLKKEAVVQLAKQLNLFGAREESSSCLWEGNMWEASLTPVAISLEEGTGKMQRDLTRQARLSCSPPHRALAGAGHPEDAAVLEMVSCTTADHTTSINPALSLLLS